LNLKRLGSGACHLAYNANMQNVQNNPAENITC
jgi:hypothetical protein